MERTPTRQLLGLLARNESLKTKGFSLTCSPSGGIVIDRWGHVHGILDFDGRSYIWVSPGSSEPVFRTGNAQSAVLYTLVTLTSG
jgi:hypothetical protein